MIYGQIKVSTQGLNLDFEKVYFGNSPSRWNHVLNYPFDTAKTHFSIDSNSVHSGRFSAKIECKRQKNPYGSWYLDLPANYRGKKITLTGFIKTKNIRKGYAGFYIRIDPNVGLVNMLSNPITGTRDWKSYSISLDLNPRKTDKIQIGCYLNGIGTMWMDDLRLSVDSVPIEKLRPYSKFDSAAIKDDEFTNGSKIEKLFVTKSQIQDLKILGLIWGYVKYYHPKIATGEVNWDAELFRILPKILEAKGAEDRDECLYEWIDKLGPFETGKVISMDSTQIIMKPDLDWIIHSGFSGKLQDLLVKLKTASRPEIHYYGALGVYSGFQAQNENSYYGSNNWAGGTKYVDCGTRILALYRFWNIIQYFYPYKNRIQGDWKNLLEEFLPKAIYSLNETEYWLVFRELCTLLEDNGTYPYGAPDSYLGNYLAPYNVEYLEDSPVITGYLPIHRLGTGTRSLDTTLKIGDILLEINGKKVEDYFQERRKYEIGVNNTIKHIYFSKKIFRSNDSLIPVGFLREGKFLQKSIKAYPKFELGQTNYLQESRFYQNFPHGNIAYLSSGTFSRQTLSEVWKGIKHKKGLILDLRNRDSGFMDWNFINSLLIKQSKPLFIPSQVSLDIPGRITYGPIEYTGGPLAGLKKNLPFHGKIIILQNESTNRYGEIALMAFHLAPHSISIGSETGGETASLTTFVLPGNFPIIISGSGFYYPDKTSIPTSGIRPDIWVKPTIEGIKKGKDEVLEKAIELLESKN